jgi:hypothetical protein
MRGWEDVNVFSKREKPANDYAKAFAETKGKATRTIQKPKGFVLPENATILD